MENESVIVLRDVSRTFRIVKHREGLVGSIKNLFYREYFTINAVEKVDLTIKKGEIVGYLGPNGSGKSTTVKMMSGILIPTSGEIYVNGKIPYINRSIAAKDIGVVFGQRSQLWWALPLIDSFKVLKEIYQIGNQAYDEIINFYKSEIDIEELLYKPVRQMSLGQRTLSDILAAFLHNPSVVFLDEPTIGLDVSMKNKVYGIIKKLNKKYHTTVVITTHDMSDVVALCERVIVINKGKIIFDDTTRNLKVYFGDYRNLQFTLSDSTWQGTCTKEKKLEILRLHCPGITFDENMVFFEGNRVSLLVDEKENSSIEILHKIHQQFKTTDVLIEDIPIEIIVRKLFEGKCSIT